MIDHATHYAKSETIRYQIIQLLVHASSSPKKELSGIELSQQLGLHRSAISKQITALRKWGLTISSKPGMGYYLPTPVSLFDPINIKEALTPFQLEFIPIINSTSSYLMEKYKQLSNGAVCLSEYQTDGRGRRGKRWLSPFASQLCFSVYWQMEQGISSVMGLSIAIGLTLAKILRQLTDLPIMLKWPNDLYLHQKKLAGILVEMQISAGDIAHVVIGIGINLSLPQTLPETELVNQPWANLFDSQENTLPQKITKEELTITVIQELHKLLASYEETGLNSDHLHQWSAMDLFAQKVVQLNIGNKTIEGINQGIDKQGGLILKRNNGEIETFIGGEISLRGSF